MYSSLSIFAACATVAGAAPKRAGSAPYSRIIGASDGAVDVTMPTGGSVLIRVPWSPWLAVLGDGPGCLTRDGDWTRLHAPGPGRYRVGGHYRIPRGTPC